MSGQKRPHEYGVGEEDSAIEHLNEALRGYDEPYWKDRADHKEIVQKLERARDEAVAAAGQRKPANQNKATSLETSRRAGLAARQDMIKKAADERRGHSQGSENEH